MLLGELLVKGQVISQQQLDDALAAQRAYGGLLGEHLIRQRAISEDSLRYYLHRQSTLLLEEENTFSRLRLINDLFKCFCATSPSHIFLCLLFLLLSVCLSLTFPFYVKLIFDVLIYARDFTAIVYLSVFILVAQVFARWFLYHASQLFNVTNVAFSGWLRRALYQKIALMRYATYIRYGSGDFVVV
jgi:ABC-type bacteriocin/lantibiotic exporter with double-glycine peptidase domain